MNSMEENIAPQKRLKRLTLVWCLIWTVLVVVLLEWDIKGIKEGSREMAIKEVRANFNKDQAFRYWGTSHGGVYVPVTEKTPPNPYLKHIPERDIKTPSGKELTLMNPAYMVRQMNEDFRDEYGIVGHITSLKLHNPQNTPDEWEKKALEEFEKGETEVLEFSEIEGKPYIRLMKPMITVEGCLKCHAYQGYKIGDMRGGVSLSAPISDMLAHEKEEIMEAAGSYGLLWFIGLLGIMFGHVKTKQYMQEREDALARLGDSEERFNRGQEVGNVGTWDWDPETDKLLWSNETFRIHGYAPGELEPTYELFLGMVHPEDREYVKKAVEKALTDRGKYEVDCRIIRKDGIEIIANARGEVVYDKSGLPQHMVGTFQDITDRKLVEKKINEASQTFEALVSASPVAIIAMDTEGKVTLWNTSAENLFGWKEEEVLGITNPIIPGSKEENFLAFNVSIRDGKVLKSIEVQRCRKDALLVDVSFSSSPLYDVEGKLRGAMAVFVDISAHKKAEKAIMKAKERADEANRAKSDFLSRMSHELRTPLNSILGFSQVLGEEGDDFSERHKTCVEEIQQAGWHLTDLINEILDISSVESGKLKINHKLVNICPMISQCINIISPMAEEKEISINFDVAKSGNEKIMADEVRFKEIMLNLLSNAVKYNKLEGKIDIVVENSGKNFLRINVSDTGEGISEKDQELLFVPFSRLEGQDPAIQGTGIGLVISRHLVELMDGKIGFESALGKGSTFWIEFPLA